MNITAELRTYLLTKSSITDRINQRIFPGTKPQGETRDCIIVQELGGERTRSMNGANEQTQTSFNLECHSQSYDRAREIAEALANVLECFSGTMGEATVQGVFCDPPNDGYLPPDAAGETLVHTISVPITLWYEAEVPSYV